jgi:4-hydroxy-2-oxoheptanedioate aldolase
MSLQPNRLKRALAANRPQFGLWCSLASNLTTEILAGSGYDWLAIDTEHSPYDMHSVLAQLQAVGGYDCEALVRLPNQDLSLAKQFLDLGARSLVFPNIDTPEQAAAIVAATRYPPNGHRGVAGMQRANRWGRVPGYQQKAEQELCLIMQIESPIGAAAAEAIAAVDGVDALFVGPSDLAATMGFIGRPGEAAVQEAILATHAAARRAGKATGILAHTEADGRRYLEAGFAMVGIGSDQGLLVRASDDLLKRFKA